MLLQEPLCFAGVHALEFPWEDAIICMCRGLRLRRTGWLWLRRPPFPAVLFWSLQEWDIQMDQCSKDLEPKLCPS